MSVAPVRSGPPPWYAKIEKKRFQHLLLRSRACIAEAFAELTLESDHWDARALAIISEAVSKVISLFMQLKSEVDGKRFVSPLSFELVLSYPGKQQAVWPPASARSRQRAARSTLVWNEAKYDRLGAVHGKLELALLFTKEYMPPYCIEFLDREITHQLGVPPPRLAIPRYRSAEELAHHGSDISGEDDDPALATGSSGGNGENAPEPSGRWADWRLKPATTTADQCWDLRIRLTAFMERFLAYNRVDGARTSYPFTVFLLRPSFCQGLELDAQEHNRSGLFGYQYFIDQGQRSWLLKQTDIAKGLKEAGINESDFDDLHLPYPLGVCHDVFFSNHSSEIRGVEEEKKIYENLPVAAKTRAFEDVVLNRGGMLEVPVYGAGFFASLPDGPELIVGFHIPSRESKVRWDAAFPEWEFSQFRSAKSAADTGKPSSAPEGGSDADLEKYGLLPGEDGILRETCKRLIGRYLRGLPPSDEIGDLVCESEPMRNLRTQYSLYAKTSLNILLCGPSGCGKSEIARDIHRLSGRKGEYKRLSAAGLTQELALSQMFGHKAGAFTGATRDHIGLLKSCDGGTLFLDDVDALDYIVQARLLSFLDNDEFYKLGEESSSTPEKSNVRLICATNEDIYDLVARRILRRDFLYRAAGVNLSVPGLRDRVADIPKLIERFIQKDFRRAGLDRQPAHDQEFVEEAQMHSWNSGEVRLLRHAVLVSMALAGKKVLTGQVLKRALEVVPNWQFDAPPEAREGSAEAKES